MCFGGSKTPKAPDPPPAPKAPAKPVSQETQRARADEKKRRTASSGLRSTILTGSQGLKTTAGTTRKTLLGGV